MIRFIFYFTASGVLLKDSGQIGHVDIHRQREIMKEIVRNDALDRVFLATDYFDASINRIAAWAVGVRNVQKALLWALLEPAEEMKKAQEAADFTKLMILQEEYKTMPFGDVWEEYLLRNGLETDLDEEVKQYEETVLSKRA